MASEKANKPAAQPAPSKRKKPRPASAGPRQRRSAPRPAPKNAFKPGTNSHTGKVFRRGPDDIPRGSATLMLKVIALDKRQTIYDSLCKLVEKPLGALAFTREFADRTEGRPVQAHVIAPARQAIFAPAPVDGVSPGPPRASASIAPPAEPRHEIAMTGRNGEKLRPL